jgi:hypothetical protein
MRFDDIPANNDHPVYADPDASVQTPGEKRRINLVPENVEQGLVQLVLSLVELIRQLMQRQALRRVESGQLTAEQVEKLGLTLERLEQKMDELKAHFQLSDLNIDLGPLGRLLDD